MTEYSKHIYGPRWCTYPGDNDDGDYDNDGGDPKVTPN